MKVLLVTNMYPTPEEPAFGTFIYDQVTALSRLGVEMDVLLINGRKSSWNYLWGLFQFWGKLITRRYHLIHAHYAMSGFVARLQFLYPLLVTYHGAEVADYVPWWLKFFARRGHHFFDQIIVVSQREKDLMIRANARVHIIPGGVDFNTFRPVPVAEARAQLGLPLDKPLVLWAGEHWQPVKRFELTKAAVELLRQRLPDVELVLVSGKPHEVIPLYMNACDVLVLTSFSEGSPTVVKEAMACNLPVVSTDVGDVASLIAGVEHCYLTTDDPQVIADKLYQVLQVRARTQGREAIKHLDSAVIVRQVAALYNQICPAAHRLELEQ
ncbi:MAG TPA: glycosyltransferase [Anaerolineae bacterium]|nr:glycosyltransferase [Anaerolineae bacterium]